MKSSSLSAGVAVTLAAALVCGPLATTTAAQAMPVVTPTTTPALSPEAWSELRQYAVDTWRSMDAMTTPATGLPADNIPGNLAAGTASGYTSPTNIGGYLWSAVVARDLGIISPNDARDRMRVTLDTLSTMERNQASGMYYNWYDPRDGSLLHTWPENGDPINQFLSSVDNGWLAASLRIVASAEPQLATEATALYTSMNFGSFFDPEPSANLPAGTNRGGFWEVAPPGCSTQHANYAGVGPDVFYTCHHYDTTVSESRIATYLGIANGQIPASGLYGTYRTLPAGCDWGWQEQLPTGTTRTYNGIPVYEGVYAYDEMAFVPSWGGSIFEELMPDLLVPESEWGATSWAVNHPVAVEVQKRHGLTEAGYGYWGFSPASDPFGGYREYGVDVAGMRSDGYTSDKEETNVDIEKPGCPGIGGTNPEPTFGDGVVTPHASFLALPYDLEGARDNLRKIKTDLNAYGPGGFYDAVAVKSGTIAERYLSLDQAISMAALGNVLDNNALKGYFVDDTLEQRLKPLIQAQTFSSSFDTAVVDPVDPVDPVTPVVPDPTSPEGGATVIAATPSGTLAATGARGESFAAFLAAAAVLAGLAVYRVRRIRCSH